MEKYGFKEIKKEKIAELKTEVAIYRHEGLGCEFLHIPCEDNNKVFAAQFVTIPENDCGTPHILEHAVLAGSEKYPLKEPFVNLLKGSLHTFLNAMTFPDRTMYPFASQNEADFLNILDVYLDAVFFPIIYKDPLILKQEGWHFALPEAEEGENKAEKAEGKGASDAKASQDSEQDSEEDKVSFNGVVYNEMQGVFSSPTSQIMYEAHRKLFDNPYSYVSGGDPKSVVKLGNEEFLAFHKRYYHPSNAKFYLYGDMPLEPVMKKLSEEFLSRFEKSEPAKPIDNATEKKEAQYSAIPYQSMDGKGFIGTTYINGDSSDGVKHMALSVIVDSLFNLDSSPLRKELIKSGFCSDIRADSDDYMRDITTNVLFDGTDETDPQKAEKIWMDALEDALKSDYKPIYRASLNKLAFELREAETGSMPKGLVYGYMGLLTWPNGCDPMESLKFEEKLKKVSDMIDSGELDKMLRKELIDNKFRATIVLKADAEAGARREAELAKAAQDAWKALGEEGRKEQLEMNAKMRKKQTTPDSEELLALLPSLKLEDLEKKNSFKAVTEEELCLPFCPMEAKMEAKKEAAEAANSDEGEKCDSNCDDSCIDCKVKLLHYDIFTSDIRYLNLMFDVAGNNLEKQDVKSISENRLFELKILSDLLGSVSTEDRDYGELTNEILSKVGGIRSRIEAYKDKVLFNFQMKFLPEQRKDAYDLAEEILRRSRFDDLNRIRELLSAMQIQMKSALIETGHIFALTRAGSYFSDFYKRKDALEGVAFYEKLCNLLENFDEHGISFCAHMKAILAELTAVDRLTISYVGDEKGKKEIESDLQNLSKALRGGPNCLSATALEKIAEEADAKEVGGSDSDCKEDACKDKACGEGLIMPSNVQYVASGGRYADEDSTFDGRFHVLNGMLSSDYLWNRVRVQLGAYGAFSRIGRMGVMLMGSYRDPNCASTVKAYRGIGNYLRNLEIGEKELVGYIIGAIAQFDHPSSPYTEGKAAIDRYFSELSLEELQRERDEILGSSLPKLKELADLFDEVLTEAPVCALGGEEVLQRDKEVFCEVRHLI